MDMLYGPIGQRQAAVHFIILSLSNRHIQDTVNDRAIFRMKSFHGSLEGWRRLFRIETQDTKSFPREYECSRGNIPPPTACVAQPLPFGQERLASTQIHFRVSTLGYVRIDLENRDGVATVVTLQRPPAGYHDSPPVPPRLDEFSLPSGFSDHDLGEALDL